MGRLDCTGGTDGAGGTWLVCFPNVPNLLSRLARAWFPRQCRRSSPQVYFRRRCCGGVRFSDARPRLPNADAAGRGGGTTATIPCRANFRRRSCVPVGASYVSSHSRTPSAVGADMSTTAGLSCLTAKFAPVHVAVPRPRYNHAARIPSHYQRANIPRIYDFMPSLDGSHPGKQYCDSPWYVLLLL